MNNAMSRRNSEAHPLLQDSPSNTFSCLPQKTTGKVLAATIVGVLLVMWCALEAWNHEVRNQLVNMGSLPNVVVFDGSGEPVGISAKFPNFAFPMTLAFIQIAAMGFGFLALWLVFSSRPREELQELQQSLVRGSHWPVLSCSHLFSVFWLQSLTLPASSSMLSLWAASHAVEVPTAAALRAKVFDIPHGGHALMASGAMSVAAMLLFLSYSKIAECLCILSGSGVILAGPALYVIYALVLTVPVANTVYQEATLYQLRTPPYLLLATQSLLACGIFFPILLVINCLEAEDTFAAIQVMKNSSEASMLVVWLCVQTMGLEMVGLGMLYFVDSFWAVAFRSLRVPFWWLRSLSGFYSNNVLFLSVMRPAASFWSFVMLCGVGLTAIALLVDQQPEKRLKESFP